MNPFTLARRPIALVCLAVAALALTGCGTAPVHPTLQAAQASGQLPPLVAQQRQTAAWMLGGEARGEARQAFMLLLELLLVGAAQAHVQIIQTLGLLPQTFARMAQA